MTLQLGVTRYSIKEKSAFPFKSELKQTFAFMVDHAGYSFQLYWFNETEQEAWIHQFSDAFLGVILPAYSNIDIHLSKTFVIRKLKLLGNIACEIYLMMSLS